MPSKVAFLCGACGWRETAAAAGELATPRSCRVCAQNHWEVLAAATDERLRFLGLERDRDVEQHMGSRVSPAGSARLERHAQDALDQQDQV